jgi:hypothetical protein
VCLVRAARQSPEVAYNSQLAAKIACQLYESADDALVQKALATIPLTSPSSLTAFEMPEVVYSFQNAYDFNMVLRYHLYRVILCGLLQKLLTVPLADIQHDVEQILRDDVEAAQGITMCVDYGLLSSAASPLHALKLLIPLQAGFGGWHRLQQRQTSTSTEEYHRASGMKRWNVEVAHIIDAMWRSNPTSYARLEMVAEAYAGGSLDEWMYKSRVSVYFQ